jgi:hypothetical protein
MSHDSSSSDDHLDTGAVCCRSHGLWTRPVEAVWQQHRRVCQGASQADVTKGSGGIWERLHYDRSDLNRVILTTTNSNVWGGASGHTYTFTRRPDGTTDIDVVVIRNGRNFKGRVLCFVLGTIGRHILESAFKNSVEATEALNRSFEAPRTDRREAAKPAGAFHDDFEPLGSSASLRH